MIPKTLQNLKLVYDKIKDEDLISDVVLERVIAQTCGFHFRTVRQYKKGLVILGYITPTDEIGVWKVKKPKKK